MLNSIRQVSPRLDSSFGCCGGWQTSAILPKENTFFCIAKAFWNHRHCRWFSLTMKIRQSHKALTDLARVARLERTTSSSQMCVGTFSRHSTALFGPFLCSGSSSLTLFCPACFKKPFRLLGFVWDWILCIKRCSVRGEQKRQAESPQRGRRKCAA